MNSVSRTTSVAAVGVSGTIVEIEADQVSQIPDIVLIGLGDTAVSEARARIRSALVNSGAVVPRKKVVLNLIPADLPKHGTNFDLALAVAVALTTSIFDDSRDPAHREDNDTADTLKNPYRTRTQAVADCVFLGELGLDGRLRPITGLLPLLYAAKQAGYRRVFFPESNAEEAKLVDGLELHPVRNLNQTLRFFGAKIPKISQQPLSAVQSSDHLDDHQVASSSSDEDLNEVIGNRQALEAICIAAAGGHNMLMIGPPGSGKSMIAQRFVHLLPDLAPAASVEVNCIRSIIGLTIEPKPTIRPPLQAPHHSTSVAALIGGGSGHIKPGLVTQAHHGVLFLDEATLFTTDALDSLRQVLEHREVIINRVRQRVTFPANFQLILAANPCPCGKYDGKTPDCTCPTHQRRRHLARLSGPLLDRVDLHIQTRSISRAELLRHAEEQPESSTDMRQRVHEAQQRARQRLSGTGWTKNAEVRGTWLRRNLPLSSTITAPLDRALERGFITMRGYDRLLRVSWTVADLAGKTAPDRNDLATALSLRTTSF